MARKYHKHQVTKTDGSYYHKVIVSHRSLFGKTLHNAELEEYKIDTILWKKARAKLNQLGEGVSKSVRKYRKHIMITGLPSMATLLMVLVLIPGGSLVGEDVYCGTSCEPTFNYTNWKYDITVCDIGNLVNVTFDQPVLSHQVYMKIEDAWVDKIEGCIYKPKGEIWEFKLVVEKKRWDTIKWTATLGDAVLDPILYPDPWYSPSEWLYVRDVNGTVETVYGNFTPSKNGVVMSKNGTTLGTLDFGVMGDSKELKSNITCNEKNRTCNLTLEHKGGKAILSFDIFHVKINYVFTNTKLMAQSLKFYFQLDTESGVTKTTDNMKEFANGMVFDYSDIRSMEINKEPVVDKAEFKDNKLRIETKSIMLTSGQKIELDPTWTTPSAVVNYSSEFMSIGKTIDDDLGASSFWSENPFSVDENEGTYEWYVTFNLGSTYEVSKIRIYADGDGSDAPCKATIIKVCDDAACSGESNLLGSDCTFSSTKEWQNCTVTATSGQYVHVEGGKYRWGASCEDKETGDDMQSFYEFDAYTAPPPDTTVPTYSGASHNTTTVGQDVLFYIQYNDDTALNPKGQYTFSTNNTGPWVNESAVNFTATPQYANVSKVLNDTVGIVVGYRWYAKDDADNWNNTEIFTLITTSAGNPDTNFSIWTGAAWELWTTQTFYWDCGESGSQCEPTNQDAGNSQCKFQICNNGTVTGDAYIKLNQTCSGMTFKFDDDYTYAGATTVETTYVNIHSSLTADECVGVCGWLDPSSPTTPCIFEMSAKVE